jgi:prophage regulatory protein
MNEITAEDRQVNLIRIPQILKMLPISKSKFWLMVQKGEFPKPIKIGRSSFWTIEQVQTFIREKTGM